jgi:hypothetical protein
MHTEPKPGLTELLIQTLSLAIRYEKQDPPNPVTRAALQHCIHDLVSTLKTLTETPMLEEPNRQEQ